MLIQRRHFLIGGAAAGLIPLTSGAQDMPPATAKPRTPFTFADGKIRAPVRIKDVDVSTVLDSGGQYHAMDIKLARDLGIKASGKMDIGAVGGKISARYSDPVDVAVAGVRLDQSQFAVLDLSKLSQGLGQPVDMILGAPLFRRYLADIDFAAQTLVFEASNDYETPDTGAMLPLTPAGALSTVEVLFTDSSAIATVDTGSAPPLVISPAAAERLGVLHRGPVSTTLVSGVGGTVVGQVTSVPMITLAGQDFADVPVIVAPLSQGSEANLGCGLLSKFRVAIDGPGGWLILSERRNSDFKRDLTGMMAEVVGTELRVTHIAPGGPAEKGGFKRGERISVINGEMAAAANSRLEGAAPGLILICSLRGGKTRTLTLSRYY